MTLSPTSTDLRYFISSKVRDAIEPNYELVRRIGEGAVAHVYELRCKKHGRPYALKVVRNEIRQRDKHGNRMIREAKAIKKLNDPHCIKIVEWNHDPTGRGTYLIMELAEGERLDQLFDGPMAVSRALEITRQVLLALHHSHEMGIVHRDIKPENVMVTETASGIPMVKVIDFGFSQHADEASPDGMLRSRTLSRQYVVGTPTYMAPELINGHEADERSDLYAVGVMLFLMLTGRRPFLSNNPMEILQQKINCPPPLLGHIAPGAFSEQLEDVVAAAADPDPHRRYATAEEFLRDVMAVQSSPGLGLALNAEPTRSWVGRKASRIARLLQRGSKASHPELSLVPR